MWDTMKVAPLLVALLWSGVSEAETVLTLKSAGRVIDRAYTAELVGDYKGARKAVFQELRAATRPEEEAGRSRLRNWLAGQKIRKTAFDEYGKTAPGYWHAFSTLENAGARRSSMLWDRALRDIPGLAGDYRQLGVVNIRFERVIGVRNLKGWKRHLSRILAKNGLRVAKQGEQARYQVRIQLDAEDASELMNRWRVRVQSDYLLRENGEERRLVGSFTKSRSVIRRNEGHARQFALRRVMDDLGAAIVYQVREDVLRDASIP